MSGQLLKIDFHAACSSRTVDVPGTPRTCRTFPFLPSALTIASAVTAASRYVFGEMFTAAGELTVLISETVGIPCFAAASINGFIAVGEIAFVRMMSAPCWTAALYCCTCSATAVCEDAVVTMMFLSTSGLCLSHFCINLKV